MPREIDRLHLGRLWQPMRNGAGFVSSEANLEDVYFLNLSNAESVS
jgi:hypothetical protein